MILAFEKWIIGGAGSEEAELLRQRMTRPKEGMPEVPVVLLTQIVGIAKRISDLVFFHTGSKVEEMRALDLSEALLNGLTHGNESDFTRKVSVELIMQEVGDLIDFTLHVDDEGAQEFSVDAEIAEALDAENIERPNGRGLLMMKKCFEYDVREPVYFDNGSGKRITITKKLPKKPEEVVPDPS